MMQQYLNNKDRREKSLVAFWDLFNLWFNILRGLQELDCGLQTQFVRIGNHIVLSLPKVEKK